MTKRFCDCCGREINGQYMPIEVPCHHYSFKGNLSMGLVDSEGVPVSGKYDKIDLCNLCSNKIFDSAMKKFYEIKGDEK